MEAQFSSFIIRASRELGLAACAALALVGAASAQPGTTEMISVTAAGAAAGDSRLGHPATGTVMSLNGRQVVFVSSAAGLPGPVSTKAQIYLRDRDLGQTERVSVAADGAAANGDSDVPALSLSGRYVAFYSTATNFGAGPADGAQHVYLRDRVANTTEWIGRAETQHRYWRSVAISAGGRFVVFYSEAPDLVPGDDNGRGDLFLRDRLTGALERVSVDNAGTSIDYSWYPAINSDGRYIAFCSMAPLVPEDTDGYVDLFVRDRLLGRTERVSVNADGSSANQHSCANPPSITGNGRYFAFDSDASDLVRDDTNGVRDVFVRDRLAGKTVRASLGSGRRQLAGWSDSVSLSDSGAVVAFRSWGDDVVRGDTNGLPDAFVHDLRTGVTTMVSISSARRLSQEPVQAVSVSADDRFIAFDSSTNFDGLDTAGTSDVFLHERREPVLYSNVAQPTVPGWFRNASFERIWDDFVPGSEGLLTGLTVAIVNSRPTSQPGGLVDIEFRRRDAGGRPTGRYLGRVTLDWSAKSFKPGPIPTLVRVENLGRFGVYIPVGDLGVAVGIEIHDPAYSLGLMTYDPPTLGGSYEGYYVGDDPTRQLCGPVPCRFGWEFRSEPALGPAFMVRPRALPFGEQMLGTSQALEFTLTNTGAYPVSLSQFSLRGRNRAQFALDQRCGQVLPVAGSCAVQVTFTPVSVGEKQAEFRLTTADGHIRTRPIHGVGVKAQMSLLPTALAFGNVRVGARSVEIPVVLTNVGTTRLPIRGIGLTGSDHGSFARRHDCPAELSPAASCRIAAWFRPARAGELSTMLGVWAAGGAGLQTVELSGRGL